MSADSNDYEDEPMVEDVRKCERCGQELYANEGRSPDDMEYGLCNDCIAGRW